MTITSRQTLVSVLVITYNSAKTICDTLISIKDQTYPNLELIITDDCSSDDTTRICKEWINANKERFARVKIITSPANTGISANYNRGEDECRGQWVKCIAGDDLLLPNCIQDYIEYTLSHPYTDILFSKVIPFGGKQAYPIFNYDFFSLTPHEQLAFLTEKGNVVPALTAFYNLERFRSLNIRCDERIPFLEDGPRWINCLRKGIRFSFIDKETAKYRLGGISNDHQRWLSVRYYRCLRLFDLLYRYPEMANTDYQKVVQLIAEYECKEYERLVNAYKRPEYRLGRILLMPFILIRRQVIVLRRKLSKCPPI